MILSECRCGSTFPRDSCTPDANTTTIPNFITTAQDGKTRRQEDSSLKTPSDLTAASIHIHTSVIIR